MKKCYSTYTPVIAIACQYRRAAFVCIVIASVNLCMHLCASSLCTYHTIPYYYNMPYINIIKELLLDEKLYQNN